MEKITGMMIYYYFVCKKKLWYFLHDIKMEAENENVILGKFIDELSYNKEEKHININNEINIDYIENNVIHEIKKSKAIEEASIWQTKYYIYYLRKKGVNIIHGQIDYPILKKTTKVELMEEDVEKIENIIIEINKLKNEAIIPYEKNNKKCMSCAYHDICLI